MECLLNPSPEDSEYKEWVALEWARYWVLSRGEFFDKKITTEFESLYTDRERHDILAVVTAMDWANRFANTTTGKVLVLSAKASEKDEDTDEESQRKVLYG
jgi:hypothetical protein